MSYRNSVRADRVSNRELRRRANAAIELGHRCYMILLAVLAQKGGEVVVTEGTIAQVGKNLASLDFVVVDGEHKGESIVRLIEGKNDRTESDTDDPLRLHEGNGRAVPAAAENVSADADVVYEINNLQGNDNKDADATDESV